jgi:hypothetical protein
MLRAYILIYVKVMDCLTGDRFIPTRASVIKLQGGIVACDRKVYGITVYAP